MGKVGTRAVAWQQNQFLEVTAGVATDFEAASLDEVGSGATGWAWSFGDGQISTLEDDSITYAGPGLYQLTLTITYGASVSRTYRRLVRVGVDLANVRGPTPTWQTFEAIWLKIMPGRGGEPILTVMPLLAASQPYDAGTPSATPVDPSGPDIAELGARIAGVYRDTALSLPVPEAELLPEGIYLLCENDVVYAGTSKQMLAAVHSLNIAHELDLKYGLASLRPWALASEMATQLESIFLWNTAPSLPSDLLDPEVGAEWLAPGLSGMALYEAEADAARADLDFNAATMSEAQDIVQPQPFRGRRAAMLWLGLTIGGLCRELRRFGENRGGVEDPARYYLPMAMLGWNLREGTLTWSAMGQNLSDVPTQELGYIASGVVTVNCQDVDPSRLQLDRLVDCAVVPGRRIWNDEATRALLGEDRELGDHVVDTVGGRRVIRMRTGQQWLGASEQRESLQIMSRAWALVSTATPPIAKPMDFTLAIAERWNSDEAAANSTRVGTVQVPGATVRMGTASDLVTVTRDPMRPAGELRSAIRTLPRLSAYKVTYGPVDVRTAATGSAVLEPWRSPLRMMQASSEPGHRSGGCGGGKRGGS